jgi:antitoxin component of MazEF toxin-antitoxin module
MVKTLTKHGNSLALLIDKPILELLRIDAHTHLRITTDGDVLIVSPVRGAEREKKIAVAETWAHKKYGRMFKRLAE